MYVEESVWELNPPRGHSKEPPQPIQVVCVYVLSDIGGRA